MLTLHETTQLGMMALHTPTCFKTQFIHLLHKAAPGLLKQMINCFFMVVHSLKAGAVSGKSVASTTCQLVQCKTSKQAVDEELEFH